MPQSGTSRSGGGSILHSDKATPLAKLAPYVMGLCLSLNSTLG